MTLEINEISVHISVSPSSQGPASTMTTWPSIAPSAHGIPSEQWDPVIQRCVREVLHQLRFRERR
jgi:hypothetical protein